MKLLLATNDYIQTDHIVELIGMKWLKTQGDLLERIPQPRSIKPRKKCLII